MKDVTEPPDIHPCTTFFTLIHATTATNSDSCTHTATTKIVSANNHNTQPSASSPHIIATSTEQQKTSRPPKKQNFTTTTKTSRPRISPAPSDHRTPDPANSGLLALRGALAADVLHPAATVFIGPPLRKLKYGDGGKAALWGLWARFREEPWADNP